MFQYRRQIVMNPRNQWSTGGASGNHAKIQRRTLEHRKYKITVAGKENKPVENLDGMVARTLRKRHPELYAKIRNIQLTQGPFVTKVVNFGREKGPIEPR
jgi:hypothetical protein